MSQNKNPFRHVRLVFRRSSLMTKTAILTALVVCTATLLILTLGIRSVKNAAEEDRMIASSLAEENAELESRHDALGSLESDKELAQEHFGLVDPDTVILTP